MKKVILVSGLYYHKEIFEKLAIPFEIQSSSYHYEYPENLPPQSIVIINSRGKATDIALRNKNCVVVGTDTVVCFEGNTIARPKDKETLAKILLNLSGKKHSVITGITLIDTSSGITVSNTDESKVLLKSLTPEIIENYIGSSQLLAGSDGYHIHNVSGNLIESIDGSYLNLLGLPVDLIINNLKEYGVSDETYSDEESFLRKHFVEMAGLSRAKYIAEKATEQDIVKSEKKEVEKGRTTDVKEKRERIFRILDKVHSNEGDNKLHQNTPLENSINVSKLFEKRYGKISDTDKKQKRKSVGKAVFKVISGILGSFHFIGKLFTGQDILLKLIVAAVLGVICFGIIFGLIRPSTP